MLQLGKGCQDPLHSGDFWGFWPSVASGLSLSRAWSVCRELLRSRVNKGRVNKGLYQEYVLVMGGVTLDDLRE